MLNIFSFRVEIAEPHVAYLWWHHIYQLVIPISTLFAEMYSITLNAFGYKI